MNVSAVKQVPIDAVKRSAYDVLKGTTYNTLQYEVASGEVVYIDGDGETLSKSNQDYMFKVHSGAKLCLYNVVLVGRHPYDGDAVRIYGPASVDIGWVTILKIDYAAGSAVSATGDPEIHLRIHQSRFQDCTGAKGGAVQFFSIKGSLVISSTTFANNRAHFSHGGAVYLRGDDTGRGVTAKILESVFINNEAHTAGHDMRQGGDGGAVYAKLLTSLMVPLIPH